MIVSLRVPSELLTQTRKIANKKQYLDISELVRYIIRQEWQSSKDPIRYEIQRLRQELKEEIRRGKIEET